MADVDLHRSCCLRQHLQSLRFDFWISSCLATKLTVQYNLLLKQASNTTEGKVRLYWSSAEQGSFAADLLWFQTVLCKAAVVLTVNPRIQWSSLASIAYWVYSRSIVALPCEAKLRSSVALYLVVYQYNCTLTTCCAHKCAIRDLKSRHLTDFEVSGWL